MSYMTLTIPVVINTCYGGFSLSKQAEDLLWLCKGYEYEIRDGVKYVKGTWKTITNVVERHDPDLVDIVNDLGPKSFGDCSKLKVVNAVVTIDIDSFDGKESIHISGYNESY